LRTALYPGRQKLFEAKGDVWFRGEIRIRRGRDSNRPGAVQGSSLPLDANLFTRWPESRAVTMQRATGALVCGCPPRAAAAQRPSDDVLFGGPTIRG
jgi:hypothetical protein